MCEGPLVSRVILYTIPIILTGILQLLFNAADLVVVGQCNGSNSVGAVGATGALINLMVNLFIVGFKMRKIMINQLNIIKNIILINPKQVK